MNRSSATLPDSPLGGSGDAGFRPVDLRSSGLFTEWTDSTSGVTSHVLSERVAPVQQSFYFTNSGFGAAGRYLWFYCAFPPGGDAYAGRTLGDADLQSGEIRHFPETQFSDGSPWVDPVTGDVYWTTGLEVWKRGPETGAPARLVNALPAAVVKNRRPVRIATHLTRSADGRRFNIDAQIGNEWIVGDIGAGEPLRVWQAFDRCYNHAQFSPTDSDLMLIAQDFWFDASTGQGGSIDDRLWLIRRGEKAWPILPGSPSSKRGHEWWDADGRHVWYVHYGVGTFRVDIETGKDEVVWRGAPLHSHCDRSGTYIVGDMEAGRDGWRVSFFNRTTGRSVDVVSKMPRAVSSLAKYHVHAHPQFCRDDRYICYTSTARGHVDCAVVEVDRLIELTV